MNIPQITEHTDDPQFLVCLPSILVAEGGNDDDPHDPGGRTSRGILQREYNAYRKLMGKPTRDVWKADWSEIFDIYYRSYWLPIAVQLWNGLNLMYFDQAVNQGPSRAAKNVQRAINNFHDPRTISKLLRAIGLKSGVVAVDGHVGVVTLAALADLKGNADFLKTYYEQDMIFYHSLSNWVRYGRGWRNRALSMYRQAVAICTGGSVTS